MPDLWNTLHSRLLLIHRYVDDAGANSSIKDSFAIHTCTFHPIGVKGCPYAPNCQIQKSWEAAWKSAEITSEDRA